MSTPTEFSEITVDGKQFMQVFSETRTNNREFTCEVCSFGRPSCGLQANGFSDAGTRCIQTLGGYYVSASDLRAQIRRAKDGHKR